MFHPQPTPFASPCFNSFGVPGIDFSFAPATPLTLQTTPHSGRPPNYSTSAANSNGNANSNSNPNTNSNTNSGGGAGANNDGHHPHPHPHPHPQSLLYSTPGPSHASTSSSASPVASSSQGHFSPVRQFSSYGSSSSKMDQSDLSMQDELAAQEAAAREYQPQLEGPLVGDKTPSTVISQEYAKADPVYVEKTMALPNMYSHYRPIQGDGNCGWRAIGFSYFETLINGGSPAQVESEIARITSLNDVLVSLGYEQFLFEDMVEETISLLRDIGNAIRDNMAAMNVLVTRFNNKDSSSHIIYHLRLLAGSWLKGNPEPYAPFIPEDMGVPGYCTNVIERVDREIEHLGIMLLVNVLLKPINLVLEIAYLDRSPGSQVNLYRFPDEANAQQMPSLGPVIYLLYRPDHYDILYKDVPQVAQVPQVPQVPVEIQVNRVSSFNHPELDIQQNLEPYQSEAYGTLAMVPGLLTPTSVGMSSLGAPPPAPSPVMGEGFVPGAQTTWMPTYSTLPAQAPPPRAPASLAPPPEPAVPASPATTYTLRFSPQYYKLDNSAFPEPHFTTTMFKNSHFNKAHYNNPDFHPEEWSPDDEAPEKAPGHKKKARGKHE